MGPHTHTDHTTQQTDADHRVRTQTATRPGHDGARGVSHAEIATRQPDVDCGIIDVRGTHQIGFQEARSAFLRSETAVPEPGDDAIATTPCTRRR